MSEGREKRRSTTAYRPGLEGLEGVRLPSALLGSWPLAAEVGASVVAGQEPASSIQAGFDQAATWDAALDGAAVGAWLDAALTQAEADVNAASDAVRDGVQSLLRYLTTAWSRAGVPAHKHDDCSQMVFVTMLDRLGRDRFDDLVGSIPTQGIPETLRPDTDHGREFYRAIDAAKKRAQRERALGSLDEGPDAVAAIDPWEESRADLRAAVDTLLSPREADLIRSLMRGEDSGEIAERWNSALKTVQNEKVRVLKKLRVYFGTEAA